MATLKKLSFALVACLITMPSLVTAGGQETPAPKRRRVSMQEQQNLFWQALQDGDADGVKKHLSEGADVNEPDADGCPPLHAAVSEEEECDAAIYTGEPDENPYREIIGVLLEAGANVTAKYGGQTALEQAASGNQAYVVNQLLPYCCGVVTRSHRVCQVLPEVGDLYELFLEAMEDEHDGVVEAISNRLIACGDTPSLELCLDWAAHEGDEVLVGKFLNAGVSTDARDAKNGTPLHTAARDGHLKVVRMLLRAGADPHAVNFSRRTPLDKAVVGNDRDVVAYLLEVDADQEALDARGKTALHLAFGGPFQIAGNPTIRLLLLYGTKMHEESMECPNWFAHPSMQRR